MCHSQVGGVGVLARDPHARCSRTEAVSHPTCPGFDAPASPPRWQEGKQAVGWVIGVSGDAGHSCQCSTGGESPAGSREQSQSSSLLSSLSCSLQSRVATLQLPNREMMPVVRIDSVGSSAARKEVAKVNTP